MGIRTIDDEAAAIALAERLNRPGRERPIVVVTTPSGRSEPWIDAEEILSQVGDVAEVVLMPTGPHSWAFSNRMPDQTQVYGGAGRVYPVGLDWVTDIRRSPLRFAFGESEGERATHMLVEDALRLAAEAGLFSAAPSPKRVHRDGVVARTYGDTRAVVKLGRDLASVPSELAFPNVPIARVLSEGMEVSGWYDPETKWYDVRESQLAPEAALAAYDVGHVVLGQVGEVSAAEASIFLHPLVEVRVTQEQVTSNELDDLTSLMTPGEVLSVRVTTAGPHWQLSLLDVDDDEEPITAASLLTGGPPWLVPPEPEPAPADAPAPEEPVLRVVEPVAVTTPSDPPAPAPGLIPSPAVLDRNRAETPAVPGKQALQSALLRIQALEADVARLRPELDATTNALRELQQQYDLLAEVNAKNQRTVDHQELQLQHLRSRLRKAGGGARGSTPHLPVFADRERGFRHSVVTAWAVRTPVGEQAEHPLPEYDLGPDFLDSLDALEGIAPSKVADVVVEVLTDRAKDLPGRDLHPLRESDAGGAPQRTREDGAAAWRVALQQNRPGARRLHFWRLPGGRVELARVGHHDDMRM